MVRVLVHTCFPTYISPVRIVAVLPCSQRCRRRLGAFVHLDVPNPLAAHGLQMVEQVEPETGHDVSVALLGVAEENYERDLHIHTSEEGQIIDFPT